MEMNETKLSILEFSSAKEDESSSEIEEREEEQVLKEKKKQPKEKKREKEFPKGIYVTGFEKTITSEMLREHFRLKPISAIKLPMSKYFLNKGFAFIYYGSKDDAAMAKQKLDHSSILRNPIRVARIASPQNISKMMVKLKVSGLSPARVSAQHASLFNERKLERLIQSLVSPIFMGQIQVNKIIIPTSNRHSQSGERRPLNYARVFFYIEDLKSAYQSARLLMTQDKSIGKNPYQVVLSFLADYLNSHDNFNKHLTAEIYHFCQSSQSNTLHFKGLKFHTNEDPDILKAELREFIQCFNRQTVIQDCYVDIKENFGAWANISFQTYQQALFTYEFLKNNQIKFRETPLYANLRNVKDLRTVVFSVIKKQATFSMVNSFLKNLAEGSKRIENTRKYDFFSFNIIEAKTLYLVNNENVLITEEENPQSFWIEKKHFPRRLVVNFFNEIVEGQFRELLVDLKGIRNWAEIFNEPIRIGHQRGHIKNDRYIKHTDLNFRRKRIEKVLTGQKEKLNESDQDSNSVPIIDYKQFCLKKTPTIPKIPPLSERNKNQSLAQLPQIGATSRPSTNMVMMSFHTAQLSPLTNFMPVKQIDPSVFPQGTLPPRTQLRIPSGYIPPAMGQLIPANSIGQKKKE